MKRKSCKYEKLYDQNLHYAVTGSSFDEYLKIKVPCMSCNEGVEFGKMFLVWCSNECSFYHKQICKKCKNELKD